MKNLLFRLLSDAYSKNIYKKILFVDTISREIFNQLSSACVVTSPSAWKQFTSIYPTCPKPRNLLLSPSIQLEEVKNVASTIQEDLLVGIGGGRIMDVTKALAKESKKLGILIPSILSTTAWINSTVSLKKGSSVHHAQGKYKQVIIDSQLIASAPPNLNYGGLMDLLVGYSGLSDWRLKRQKKRKKMSEFTENVVLDYCDRIRSFMESPDELTPERIPCMARYFIEGIANCYGLLSNYPLDGGEHLLYYAIEEKINLNMNHGAVISLCTLICLRLHGLNSYLPPDHFKKLMDICNIKYTLEDLQISKNQLTSILEEMTDYVENNNCPYSIWNETSEIKDIILKNV